MPLVELSTLQQYGNSKKVIDNILRLHGSYDLLLIKRHQNHRTEYINLKPYNDDYCKYRYYNKRIKCISRGRPQDHLREKTQDSKRLPVRSFWRVITSTE